MGTRSTRLVNGYLEGVSALHDDELGETYHATKRRRLRYGDNQDESASSSRVDSLIANTPPVCSDGCEYSQHKLLSCRTDEPDVQALRSDIGAAPPRIVVRSCRLKATEFMFQLDLVGKDGAVELSLLRSLVQLERANQELQEQTSNGTDRLSEFQILTPLALCLARAQGRYIEICDDLARWLNDVIKRELFLQSALLSSTLGVPRFVSLSRNKFAPNLTTLIDCHEPLIYEIVSYLADTPLDMVYFTRCCVQLSTFASKAAMMRNWESLYSCRWPAFYDCLRFHGAGNWYSLYRDTLLGRTECTLEVFDRERKPGFAMSAMVAHVLFEKAGDDSEGYFIARYLSASEVPLEVIPASEEFRLRFCPAPARKQLNPSCPIPLPEGTRHHDLDERYVVGGSCSSSRYFAHGRFTDTTTSLSAATSQGDGLSYPYAVFRGLKDLKVGDGVELQWKMQMGSPFGWWYGHLEALDRNNDGKTVTATLTFRHFPIASRWHRLRVVVGDGEMRRCTFGGYTGGLQPVVGDASKKRWMRFSPKQLVTFP